MKFAALCLVLAASPCLARASDYHGQYETDEFTVKYVVPDGVESALTHLYSAARKGPNGTIYSRADPPTGVLQTKPGARNQSIALLSVSSFPGDVRTPTDLVSALRQHISSSPRMSVDRDAQFETKEISGRSWVRVIWTLKDSGLINRVVWYTFASRDQLLLAGYGFYPGIRSSSSESILNETSVAVSRIEIIPRMPNQLPDPTSPSVTPPAGAGGAPSVTADH